MPKKATKKEGIKNGGKSPKPQKVRTVKEAMKKPKQTNNVKSDEDLETSQNGTKATLTKKSVRKSTTNVNNVRKKSPGSCERRYATRRKETSKKDTAKDTRKDDTKKNSNTAKKAATKKTEPQTSAKRKGAKTSGGKSSEKRARQDVDVTNNQSGENPVADVSAESQNSFKESGVDVQSLVDSSTMKLIKLVSWNVNGLRAWIGHDGLDFVKKCLPDVFCIQETKCSEIPDSFEMPNYHCYWLSGDREGYSGVAVLTRVKPHCVKAGIGVAEHDKEGRVLTLEFAKFVLVAVYVPNAGRNLVRLPYRESWDEEFSKYIGSLKKPVVICGDLNVAHKEIDLKNPKNNIKNAGFTNEERRNFTKLLEDRQLIDSFRYLHPNEKDAYTFWSYMRNAREKNIGWRVDYFLLSSSMISHLDSSSILKEVAGSDHCPIELVMSFR